MIFKELLDICSHEEVTQKLLCMYNNQDLDYEFYCHKVKNLIDELKSNNDYDEIPYKKVCFLCVPTGSNDSIKFHTGLYYIKENDNKDHSGTDYYITGQMGWCFTARQALGIEVFILSFEKYGADEIVAGVLDFILNGE